MEGQRIDDATGKQQVLREVVRVVDVVVVRMREASSNSLLVEAQHTLPDGREIVTNRLPAKKLPPGGNVWAAARQLVNDKLDLADQDVEIRDGCEDIVDDERESPSYPGLRHLLS